MSETDRQTTCEEVLKGLRALLDEQIAARSAPLRQGIKIPVE